MKALKAYKVGIFGLGHGVHHFNFTFDNDFFLHFENSLISKGKGTCDVVLTKTGFMITVDLNIKGAIELVCDKSLEPFYYPIDIEKGIIYKYGNERKELSDDVFVILQGEQEINISTFLYETISLEIPMKKLHPKFQTESDSDEMVYVSETDGQSQGGNKDPRWEALEKLK